MPEFRIIIAGSRGFDFRSPVTQDTFFRKIDNLVSAKQATHDIVIVSGTAKGADKFGESYARIRGYECRQYPANWDLYGKRAGYMRNVLMAQNADALIAIWDGESRGTQHMINIASDNGLAVRVTHY